jgi:tetratricopeptide (TPR) repeat protein
VSAATPSYKEEIRRAEKLRRSGQTRLAAEVLCNVLAADKEHFAANYCLGMLHHRAGRNDLAIPLLEKAVAARPTVFEAAINLGIIQRDEGLLAAAQANLENAVAIQPDNAMAHITLGMLLMDRNELDAALVEVELGRQLDPDNPETWGRLGMLMQIRGEPARAAGFYRKVIGRKSLDGTAHRSLAFLQRQTEYTDDIKRMEEAIRSPDASRRDRMLLGYALGKVFDDLGQYDQAFDHLHNANQLQRQSFEYSFEKQKAFFDRHKKGLDRAFLSHCEDHVVTDRTAIFVLGMPRSGTSLVEQILASHPLVHGAGEVEYTRLFVDAVEKKTRKPFPVDIGTVPPEVLQAAGRAYVKKLRLNAGGAERVIDKLPHNFLRVGLFAAVMPNARIILCDRNPLDNCLSIYQHVFDPAHAYSSDLEELGRYYRLYQDLMGWWEQILPGHICRVNYEELVRDTENQVRRLLAHCELPFDENCLSFHENRRPVKTPSASQVREPIYQGSIDRWKNYEKHLEPLRTALESTPAHS